jgi:hypothetical protein
MEHTLAKQNPVCQWRKASVRHALSNSALLDTAWSKNWVFTTKTHKHKEEKDLNSLCILSVLIFSWSTSSYEMVRQASFPSVHGFHGTVTPGLAGRLLLGLFVFLSRYDFFGKAHPAATEIQ